MALHDGPHGKLECVGLDPIPDGAGRPAAGHPQFIELRRGEQSADCRHVQRILEGHAFKYRPIEFTVAVGVFVFDMSATLTPLVLAFLAIGVLLFAGIGMLLGTVIRDPETGVAIANAIGFPMMFLSGSFFEIASFPPYMQTVAQFLPLTYLNDGLRDTMIYGNTESALGNLAVMIVIAVIFFVLASKLMSWKEK